MQIDKQTLNDLEIFRAVDESISIFKLFDITRTMGGSNRLRDKLINPPDSFRKLLLQQQSIRYFTEREEPFKLPMGDMQLKEVEEYFSTNIEVVATEQWLSSLQFFFADKSSFRFLKNSMPLVIQFVEALKQMLHKGGNNFPVILQQADAQIQTLWSDSVFQKVYEMTRRPYVSFHQWLQADRLLRTLLKDRYKALIETYFELDALNALAVTTKEMQFNFPELIESEQSLFYVEEMYNPLLLRWEPSSLNMNNDHNFVFLTGPNMSGKSTFLKAIGLTVYLAHIGMGVPAKSARISYVDRLLTGFTFADNVVTGYSYFFSEVQRVKELAVSLSKGERVFAIFDELFRGTNVKDALEATSMIISELMAWRESLFVISSHLTEVEETVNKFPNTQSLFFESLMEDGVPVFTYRLLEGVSTMRLGMTIIDNEGIAQMLKRNSHLG
jgi:DNA mismatch repair ATPase MutS